MKKLRFETEDSNHGLSTTRGFSWFSEDVLMFEYQVSDSIFEILKSELKELTVPFAQIETISFKNSWFSGGKILVELGSLKNIDKTPFLEDAVLCLEIERKNKDTAKEFAVNANLALANFKFDQLG